MHATLSRELFASLHIAIAVQLHYHVASCFLFDAIHNHGLHSSYKQIKRFGRSSAVCQGTDMPNNTKEFVQYAAGNINHNMRIIDGNNTFHGIGILARTVAQSLEPKSTKYIY